MVQDRDNGSFEAYWMTDSMKWSGTSLWNWRTS